MTIKTIYTKVKAEIKKLQKAGVSIPDIPPLAEFNVDTLKADYADYKANGREPQLVFIPPMAWDAWDELFKQYKPTKSGLWRSSEFDSTELLENKNWTVCILPATDKPTFTKIAYNEKFDGQTARDCSPNVDAYLALQWMRLLQGKDPVDRDTWTFLNIADYKGKYAPASFWGPGGGRVRVGCGNVGIANVDLGVRLPVLGKPGSLAPSSVSFDLNTELKKLTDKAYAEGWNDALKQAKESLPGEMEDV